MIKILLPALAFMACTGSNTQTQTSAMINSTHISPDSIPNIYGFSVEKLEGGTISLADFKGKYLLLVNTASECGYTPQYKDLQKLHETHGHQLVVIGFPANNFGSQEPGSNVEISGFCKKNYGVSFPMAAKISVKGQDMAPLYQWLTQKKLNGVMDAEVSWNFNKFLVGKDGRLITKFESSVEPMSEEILSLLK